MAGITPSRGIPLVRINVGSFAGTGVELVRQFNLVATSQAAAVKDRIPPRLLTGTLRGTIEDLVMVSKGGTTNPAPNVTIRFFGNDLFHTTVIASNKLMGAENVAIGD